MKKLIFFLVIIINSLGLYANKITKYEFWIDNNVAGRITENADDNDGVFNLNYNYVLHEIKNGVHTINVRFQDSTGKWSVVKSALFFAISDKNIDEGYSANSNNVIAYEYWFDLDYSNKMKIDLDSPSDNFLILQNLNVSSLSNGIHQFNIRFKDSIGKWSVVKSSLFLKYSGDGYFNNPEHSSNNIKSFEYWFDNDIGSRKCQNANPVNSIYFLDADFDVSNLTRGVHILNMRFKDSIGGWSVVNSKMFYNLGGQSKFNDIIFSSNKILGYRWWFDSDLSTLTEIQLDEPTEKYDSLMFFSCPNLDTSKSHIINIQFMDSVGKWSVGVADTFIFDGFKISKPSLKSPRNNTYVLKETEVEWNLVPYSTKYEIQIATDNSFSNLVVNMDSTAETKEYFSLDMSKVHYWRVRAYYFDEAGDWSDIWKFTTKGPPAMDTIKLVSFSKTSVKIESNITSNGGESITSRGICWNTTGNPTINDSFTNDGTSIGKIESIAANLQKNTKYYFRGYAVNSIGITYTEQIEVTTDNDTYFEINLAAGWNMISSNYLPNEPDSLEYIYNDIKSNVTIVKNNDGAVYIPQFAINSIGEWNVSQGYQVYMSNSAVLKIYGEEVNPALTGISLKSGWNMSAYLRNSEMDAASAFVNITDNWNLVIAKDIKGNVYIPSFGINSIGNLKPGMGYRIYVTSNDTLFYPDN